MTNDNINCDMQNAIIYTSPWTFHNEYKFPTFSW